MHPIICQIGPLTIYSYGLMLAIAVVVCSSLLSRDAKRYQIKSEVILDLVFWIVVFGLIGARIFYVLLNLDFYLNHPWKIIAIQEGGLAWQGSFVSGMLAGIFFIKKHALPLRPTLDLVAPYIALGHSIGRIGCFLNGCCYGREVPWGIFFPAYQARLHPTQLYESVSLFIVYVILKKYQSRSPQPGMVFVFYLFLSSLERFVVEFFRADHEWTWAGLSVFQIISLMILAVSVYARIYIKSRSGK